MALKSFDDYIFLAEKAHGHICAGQVLGLRMALYGVRLLGIEDPAGADRKRLVTFVEIDRCATDAITVVTGCRMGKRALKFRDFGKVAATFVDTHTGRAVRIAPRPEARLRSHTYAPEARHAWEANLLGYQRMPAAELLNAHIVQLRAPLEQLLSRAGQKALCEVCGEEIMNEREVLSAGQTLCRACAGESYYLLPASLMMPSRLSPNAHKSRV